MWDIMYVCPSRKPISGILYVSPREPARLETYNEASKEQANNHTWYPLCYPGWTSTKALNPFSAEISLNLGPRVVAHRCWPLTGWLRDEWCFSFSDWASHPLSPVSTRWFLTRVKTEKNRNRLPEQVGADPSVPRLNFFRGDWDLRSIFFLELSHLVIRLPCLDPRFKWIP